MRAHARDGVDTTTTTLKDLNKLVQNNSCSCFQLESLNCWLNFAQFLKYRLVRVSNSNFGHIVYYCMILRRGYQIQCEKTICNVFCQSYIVLAH